MVNKDDNLRLSLLEVNQLQTLAQQLEKDVAVELKNSAGELSKSWKGSNAESFMYKCERLAKRVGNESQKMILLAEEIETLTKRMYL